MFKLKKEFKEGLVGAEWKHYKNKIYGNDELEARYYFTDRRINQKYIQLYNKYKNIHTLDWDIMFSECLDIIFDILDNMDKDYIYISEQKKKDDISYIITTMEQRIDDKINDWTGAYRDRTDGKDKIVDIDVPIYLDEVIYEDENGLEITKGEMISTDDIVKKEYKTDEEIDITLQKIYIDAKLTQNQIEVLQALEMTEDNYNNGEIYTKVDASKILGKTEGNVRKTFNVIKNKIIKAYDGQVPEINTRQDKMQMLENFLNNIEDEKDVIDFINNNINEEFVLYILYDSDIDSELVRYFNLNKNKDIHTDTMRQFCTYFIKEVYNYIELLKYNDNMSKVKRLPVKPQKPKVMGKFVDNTVYTYIREDKATGQEKQDEYIVVDGEKYYSIAPEKNVNII